MIQMSDVKARIEYPEDCAPSRSPSAEDERSHRSPRANDGISQPSAGETASKRGGLSWRPFSQQWRASRLSGAMLLWYSGSVGIGCRLAVGRLDR